MLRHMLAEHSKEYDIDPKPKANGVERRGRPKKTTDFSERICHECFRTFKDQFSVARHVAKVHEGRGLQCTFCGKVIENMDIGRAHLVRKHEAEWQKLTDESVLQVVPMGNTLYVHEDPTIIKLALKPLYDSRKKI